MAVDSISLATAAIQHALKPKDDFLLKP